MWASGIAGKQEYYKEEMARLGIGKKSIYDGSSFDNTTPSSQSACGPDLARSSSSGHYREYHQSHSRNYSSAGAGQSSRSSDTSYQAGRSGSSYPNTTSNQSSHSGGGRDTAETNQRWPDHINRHIHEGIKALPRPRLMQPGARDCRDATDMFRDRPDRMVKVCPLCQSYNVDTKIYTRDVRREHEDTRRLPYWQQLPTQCIACRIEFPIDTLIGHCQCCDSRMCSLHCAIPFSENGPREGYWEPADQHQTQHRSRTTHGYRRFDDEGHYRGRDRDRR